MVVAASQCNMPNGDLNSMLSSLLRNCSFLLASSSFAIVPLVIGVRPHRVAVNHVLFIEHLLNEKLVVEAHFALLIQ